MKRKTNLKIAAALIATTLIATPFAASYAGQGGYGGHGGPGEWAMFEGGHHSGPKHDGPRGGFGKGDHSHREDRDRTTPLTPAEARILIDAMLLKTNVTDLKTGDALLAEEPGKIDVLLVNTDGGVVDVIKFDAKTGRMDRDERRTLRKLLPRPDRAERYNRKFDANQMSLLANAMVIRFGKGDLKLGEIAQTPRGTYSATVTNNAGDIVREMELSSVTGRPIS
ncbi:hypothetical protein [Thalassospira sp.]|uniref:hypothetical protein n=1 Tax=Thalassospira sp. TaxID=1912094 RepID=UPI0032EAA306